MRPLKIALFMPVIFLLLVVIFIDLEIERRLGKWPKYAQFVEVKSAIYQRVLSSKVYVMGVVRTLIFL